MYIVFGSLYSYCSTKHWEEVAVIETQGNSVWSQAVIFVDNGISSLERLMLAIKIEVMILTSFSINNPEGIDEI